MEMSMRSYGYLPNLKRRFKIMTVAIMSLALCKSPLDADELFRPYGFSVEHLLFVTNSIAAVKACKNEEKHPIEIYFAMAFPHVFAMIEYSHWKAFLMEVA